MKIMNFDILVDKILMIAIYFFDNMALRNERIKKYRFILPELIILKIWFFLYA
jgi:hypothetical protein